MTNIGKIDDFGTLIEPATLKIQRLLPGPIERVWSYLTEDEFLSKWLASAGMELKVGAPFEFVWRNDTLTNPPGNKPAGFGGEHRMQSKITALEPLRRLAFTWVGSGDVSFELEPSGDQVLLTIIHRRLADRSNLLSVSAGWHAHIDILTGRISGIEPEPFWNNWARLKDAYGRKIPA
ncbi:MAG: ATPase [Thalassospira sp.]|mgnify:FL=1|uniref:SRPBCC family protein n=1 Tax=Thalassospira sp. TaxID=1912094 RepID=UPI000C3DB920|nr:SRPBCC family protein [Thalassospira sp.]MAZ35553.1 ATPase [Thalassospira sp.]|tara:strand:+ start:119 stop:652 length:534 start_codon:yes stop_codon:yes gene_type:complete